jgi:hypothetical protein
MYQPYPSSGQPAGPLRPPAPAPVRTAVKLMYAGAAVSAVDLIIGLVVIIVDVKAAARGRFWGYSITAPQMKPILITVWIVAGLIGIALWLWMARANGQGRNWARILSTVLFVLATLQLISDLQQAVSPAGTIEPVLGLLLAVLGWLPGLSAVWLLWHPASSAFFKPQGVTQALARRV